ncbi:hypothetical protein [Stenotrophobium rhamnosiphilum]|uniref:Uncharacterized protein n=1 Tax=Stenotrophobium rhamnosiphilum TaxID=2029166 RepID=A0A2T5MIJ9_9GAMM|nr:hypothetical protein [Stenotrophobium rhamnosiphilum]PTU32401.1 hypothetical protein CJD38_07060 [Stenotrophobium rhamnosiphilum]
MSRSKVSKSSWVAQYLESAPEKYEGFNHFEQRLLQSLHENGCIGIDMPAVHEKQAAVKQALELYESVISAKSDPEALALIAARPLSGWGVLGLILIAHERGNSRRAGKGPKTKEEKYAAQNEEGRKYFLAQWTLRTQRKEKLSQDDFLDILYPILLRDFNIRAKRSTVKRDWFKPL